MKKIALIIQREYLSRVKKKSFIIMTFLGPLLIAAMYAFAIFLAVNSEGLSDKKKIVVCDETNTLSNIIKSNAQYEFEFSSLSLASLKNNFDSSGNSYLLYIPQKSINFEGVQLYSDKQPSLAIVKYIEDQLENTLSDQKLAAKGISKKIISELDFNLNIETIRFTDEGEQDGNTSVSYMIGMFSSILIYMFIFLYGVQVMRGVIEEKNNRIVEVLISSVKPFQLMMGKIVGIALVGLTQFALWVILTSAITGIIGQKFAQDKSKLMSIEKTVDTSNSDKSDPAIAAGEVLNALSTINYPLVIGCFLFYFLGGYLLYSALFAAIGSAVDSESETQQFMMPVTIPLIFSFIISTSTVVNNPDGPVAFWLSLIPLSSPIVMMVRLPFGVPTWEIITSMLLLIAGFFGTVWLAAKIYRTGILMVGKKTSWKEIGKWLFYKN
jgi:ABC-2 type transport system permease protein